MRFCQTHWDKLRDAIKKRGVIEFVAIDGVEAAKQMQSEIQGERKTKQNFDPLMAAHWMIVNNAMDQLKYIGQNPLILMVSDPERPQLECPICCLNWLSLEHDRACTDPNCKKPKGLTFDDWIDKAADGAVSALNDLPDK